MEPHHGPARRRNNDDESLKTQNPVAGPLTDVNISSIIANASVASLRLIHIASEQPIHIAGIRNNITLLEIANFTVACLNPDFSFSDAERIEALRGCAGYSVAAPRYHIFWKNSPAKCGGGLDGTVVDGTCWRRKANLGEGQGHFSEMCVPVVCSVDLRICNARRWVFWLHGMSRCVLVSSLTGETGRHAVTIRSPTTTTPPINAEFFTKNGELFMGTSLMFRVWIRIITDACRLLVDGAQVWLSGRAGRRHLEADITAD